MKVDLAPFLNSDKNFKGNSGAFVGTTIQSLGELKGYTVHMCFMGMAIPSKVVGTFDEAMAIESAVWDAVGGVQK